MTDNIDPDEIKRRLILFLRIPSETWTDVFKFLPRRNLIQNISPACFRLKEICNKNVKTVHVISNAYLFNCKLRADANDPEANKQLAHLAGHKCLLAGQFRLTRIRIVEKNKAILHHCLDLFRGCHLLLVLREFEKATFIDECLTCLGKAKPIVVDICMRMDQHLRFNQLLHHPTIWNCSRILLTPPFGPINPMPLAVTSFDWLHHQPSGVDSNDGADEQIRCLTIQCNYGLGQESIVWLVNRCIQEFQQSQGPMDQRRFMLSFSHLLSAQINRLGQFERHHQNQASGEVLLLGRDDGDGQLGWVYHLRRCLAEEAAGDDGGEFYGKILKLDREGFDEFGNGSETAQVIIK